MPLASEPIEPALHRDLRPLLDLGGRNNQPRLAAAAGRHKVLAAHAGRLLRRLSPAWTLVPLAAAVRLAVGFLLPNVIAADEVYQYLGQARRLVFGTGVVPWEFRVGLRNWLIPLLLAGPMRLAQWIDPGPAVGVGLIRALLSVTSLVVVVCAIRWGQRFHGLRGAWICGATAALWPDLWVMAPHPLEDTLSAYALIAALGLIEPWPATGGLRRVAQAGALLGLTFVLRNPLAPAVAVAGIGMCRADPRRWLVGLAAGATPVALAGLLDWVTWGHPFRSFWLNLLLNGPDGVGSAFGTLGPGFYPAALFSDWLWATPLILALAVLGARSLPLTALTALAVLATYWPVAHKELRFLFPMIALLVPLVGLGLAQIVTSEWSGRKRRLPVIAAVSVLASGLLTSPVLRIELSNLVAGARASIALARLGPEAVGSSLLRIPGDLYFAPHTVVGAVTADADLAAFDALILAADAARPPARFRLIGCYAPPFRLLPPDRDPALCAWSAASREPEIPVPPLERLLKFPAMARPFTLEGWRAAPE